MRESIWSRVARGDFRLLPPTEAAMSGVGVDIPESMRREVAEAVRGCVRFDVGPVAEYFYAENAQDEWTWKTDFPNLAPPFPAMWMEHGRCSRMLAGTVSRPFSPDVSGIAVRVTGMTVDVAAVQLADVARLAGALPQAVAPPDAEWYVAFEPFCWLRGRGVYGPYGMYGLWVGTDGSVLTDPTIVVPYPVKKGDEETLQSAALAFPFAFAISLMHCKNVGIVDVPDARTPLERRRDERRGVPSPSFKTLVIEPMKRALKTEGGSESVGLKRALHICRGHFAHYSEDKPMFGRYAGRFWIPAHTRGTAESGIVVKDYRVEAARAAS